MAFDLMNLQKNEISSNIGTQYSLIYGKSKVGKSTLASKLCGDDGLLIATEKGYALLPVYAIDLTNWSETNGLLRQLKLPEVKEKFKTIIIDTIDLAYDLCIAYTLKINGCQDLSDKPFGKLYGEVDKLFNNFLLEITRMGYGLILISHAKAQSKLVKSNNKENEVDYIQPSLARRGYQIVANMVDHIFYCDIQVNENGEEERVLRTRATSEYFAGSRYEHLKETIAMNAEELNKAIEQAIKEQGATTSEKKVRVAEEIKVDFNEIIEKLNALVMEKFVPNDKLKIVNKIVENYLGTGNRVADATEEQSDALQLILDELLMKAEELGL